jgi:undecaprenyl pyrophosphate synthase
MLLLHGLDDVGFFRAILNICFAYTSTEEFERSASEIADGVSRREIQPK